MTSIKSDLEAIENVKYVSATDSTDKNGTWKILVNQFITEAQIGQVNTLLSTTPTSDGLIMPPKRVRQPRDRYLTSTRNYWSKTLGNWKAANIPQINSWTNKFPSGWTPTTTQATPPEILASSILSAHSTIGRFHKTPSRPEENNRQTSSTPTGDQVGTPTPVKKDTDPSERPKHHTGTTQPGQ